ncbi:MAG: hypothetical protein P8090_15440 [Gammaproteobacteria bacterium]
MSEALVCWKSGAPLDDQPLPLGRLAECGACGAQLHVCRLCRFYDPTVSQSCREPVADAVGEKERANFCGYFQPRSGAYRAPDDAAARTAAAELDALFGGAATSAPESEHDDPRSELDRLFDPPPGKD